MLKSKVIDDVFGTPDVVKRLSEIKKVRLFRQPSVFDESVLSYGDFWPPAPFVS